MGRQKLIDALEDDDKKAELSDELVVQENSLDEEGKALLSALQKKNQLKDEKIKDLQQDREQRKILSYALFGFMCIYMAAVLAVVFYVDSLLCISVILFLEFY